LKLRRYRVAYTQDQLRYTPPCALDFTIPITVAKEILTRSADETCQDGKLRYGKSKVIMSEHGLIEIEEENSEDTSRIISLLAEKVGLKQL
jgi:hypothetical protein